MADETQADPAVLRGNAPQFDTIAAGVQDALRTLQGRITAVGQCWGQSDEVAQQFAGKYIPGRDKLLPAVGTFAEAVRNTGDGIRAAADVLEAADRHNARLAEQ